MIEATIRVRSRAVLCAVLLWLAGCAPGGAQLSSIPFAEAPETTFLTNDYAVGAEYTIGSILLPDDALRPIEVISLEVLRSEGIDILGFRIYIPDSEEDVGLIPGWEPDVNLAGGRVLGSNGVRMDAESLSLAVGVKTLEPHSGLRGFRTKWRDGAGIERVSTLDLAVVTCAPGACVADSIDSSDGWLLKELGLVDAND